MLVKALALTTLIRAASAATDFYVDWDDDTNKNTKVKNPVQTWKYVGNLGSCKELCAQHAGENYYVDHFICSYQDEKPHKCTVSANDNTKSGDYNNWKMVKGHPHPSRC